MTKEQIHKQTAKEVSDKIKETIFAMLRHESINLHNELYPEKAEKEMAKLTGFAKVILYQINRNVLNKDYDLNEPLNAFNQFLAEKDLAQKYGFEVKKTTKEQQIDELSEEICNGCQTRYECDHHSGCVMSDIVAEWLINKGYGKLREFAESLKDGIQEMTMESSSEYNDIYNEALNDVQEFIDELTKKYVIHEAKK